MKIDRRGAILTFSIVEAAWHAEQAESTVPERDEAVTDWARVEAMTPQEVLQAALADPDAQPLSREQLARMRRFPDPVRIRGQLNQMTQLRFARLFQIPLGTLRDWEQKAHFPDGAAIALLRIIERDPIAAALALNPDLTEAEIAQELGLPHAIVSRV